MIKTARQLRLAIGSSALMLCVVALALGGWRRECSEVGGPHLREISGSS